ncbi:MAG: RNA polymerase sigma factor [Blastocatellia bacterium]
MDEQHAIRSFFCDHTEEGFCCLFVAVYPRVRRYFLVRNVEEPTAEELAQTVLFKVYQKAADLKDPALFFGWLFAIARNELLQHWRKQQARIETVELEPLADSFTVPPAVLMQAEFDEWLARLEPNERELVRLRFVEGLTYEELAVALGVPLGTVESRLFSVRKKLLRIRQNQAGERKQPSKK